MISIKTLVVGDLSTNCYLVSDPVTNDTVIIDPGDDADFITETIINEKLKPVAIVLTHGHFDHVLGCLELKLNFPIPICLNEGDKKLYTSANQSATHWLHKQTLKVPPIDQLIKEGDKIKVGNEELIVIETPGHTPGSICLYHSSLPATDYQLQASILFTGDTLFADGIGETNHSYSSPLQLTKSLAKIRRLPQNTIIHPGHGNPTHLSLSHFT